MKTQRSPKTWWLAFCLLSIFCTISITNAQTEPTGNLDSIRTSFIGDLTELEKEIDKIERLIRDGEQESTKKLETRITVMKTYYRLKAVHQLIYRWYEGESHKKFINFITSKAHSGISFKNAQWDDLLQFITEDETNRILLEALGFSLFSDTEKILSPFNHVYQDFHQNQDLITNIINGRFSYLLSPSEFNELSISGVRV